MEDRVRIHRHPDRSHPAAGTALRVAAVLLSVLTGSFAAPAVIAQTNASIDTGIKVTAKSTIDWEKAELRLTLTAPVQDGGKNAPAAGYRSEQSAERDFPQLLSQAILPIQIDSLHTAADLVRATPGLYRSFADAAKGADRGYPAYSADLRSVSLPYTIPLFPTIGSLFIHHTYPSPVNRTLRWVPNDKFTGLVIYAKGDLPVHGTDRSAQIVPCLFPDIFDSDMRTVIEKLQMDPAYLKRWGAAAYTQGFGEKQFIDRIGLSPLRVVAAGLFGETPTDPIISPEDADRLLSTENNRRLLAQGRILIIYGAR